MIPDIGSEWIARDGRKMRVLSIKTAGIGQKHARAVMYVLNPEYRARTVTELSVANFGSETHIGFLRPLIKEPVKEVT